ncbi:MAG TPA: flagellar basal-body MS-ring/collar protein FliF [Candidatus Avimonas sp.]|nr:flagellar M-ring protein FliF [Clostridiales bacterium]HPU58766.1 flagellar basal-body MS-ring/collar protein FliF [Candidatus Avimonas sp.]
MPSDILKQITEFWNKLSKKVKTAILVGLASIVFISIIATVLLNLKSYEVLYSGLSSQEQAQIVAKLSDLGVDYKTQAGGIILVPDGQVASLKMQLSQEGYPKSTLTYDLFINSNSLMTTDFEKRQFLVFQLQERLQESIKTINGVRNAIVTLSITDESNYVLETDVVPSTASVIIDVESSVSLTPKQIKGIENLIAKSVPGLTAENVAIIDSEGNILNPRSSTGANVSLEKVELEKQAGDIYREKIIQLLEPIYGEKGVSVAVNVSIDFSQKQTQQIEYTPVETGNANQNDTDRVLNEIQSQIINNGGEVSNITASIIINKQISDQDRATVNSIIAKSLGVDEENIIVTGMEFTAANERYRKAQEALNRKPSFFDQYGKYLIPSIAAVIVSIFAFILVMVLLKKKKKAKPAFEYKEVKNALTQLAQTEEVPAIVLSETREQGLKRQIREFSESNPQIVAQLIKTWLKEEDE